MDFKSLKQIILNYIYIYIFLLTNKCKVNRKYIKNHLTLLLLNRTHDHLQHLIFLPNLLCDALKDNLQAY